MQQHAFLDLAKLSRTIRRYTENRRILKSDLLALTELARLASSGGNIQPLKYMLSWTAKRNAQIFPTLAWAGYLKDWGGPAPGERPAAYIIILGDTDITTRFNHDPGLVSQMLMLGATSRGLGACIIGSIQRTKLRRVLDIPKRYRILLVVSLGYPAEKVRLETAPEGDIRYWRDQRDVHHVPKRPLRELILN